MRVLVACVAVAAIPVAGCAGDDEPKTVVSPPKTVTTRDVELSAEPPRNPPVRKCAACTRNRGERVDLDSRRNVRAGPLVLYSAREFADAPQSEFDPVRNGSVYRAVKLLLLIEGSQAVTLQIPPAGRAHASLLYEQKRGYSPAEKRRGLAQVSDGYAAVRFEPFRRGRGPISEFPGGLVVAGARCLALHVWVEERERPIRRVVSFGAGDRC